MILRAAALIWINLIFCADSFSQILPFDHYSSKDGLLSDYVLAICADSRGYLWIGTNDGLSLYDGDAFRNYTVADGLAFSRITCMIESGADPGTIWIGTNGGGVSRLKEGRFRTYHLGPSQQSNMVACLFEDRQGRVWCGSVDGVYRLEEGGFRRYRPETYSGPTNSISETADGDVWICTSDGFYLERQRDPAPRKIIDSHLLVSAISCIHPGADSTLWAGYEDGALRQFRDGRLIRETRLPVGGIAYFLDDGNGYLVGTGSGVYRMGKAGDGPSLYFSTMNGLPEDYVTCGAVDREGVLWFGLGSKGIAKLTTRAVITLPVKYMTFAPNGSCAAVDGKNHLWVTSESGIWEIWERGPDRWRTKLHTETERDAHRSPFNLLYDAPGTLWVGCDSGPILSYSIVSHSGEASSLHLTREWLRGRDFPHGSPLFLYRDREGMLWASMSENRGVYLFDPNRRIPFVRSYTSDDGLPDNSVRALREDQRGNFWFGGYDNGLALLPASRKLTGPAKYFGASDGLPNTSIRSIDEDSTGALWIGTRYGGMAMYRDSVFQTISLKDGLTSTAVWSSTNGRLGHWFGTQLGFQELLSTSPLRFSAKKEFQGRPVYACGELAAQWLWLVTDAGVMFYDRSNDPPNIVPPPIYLTDVRVNGVTVDVHQSLSLAYDQNSLSIDVIGLSFRDEKAVRYQYMLTPNDTGWSAPSSHHSIIFAALAPGSYLFKARSINASGIASSQAAEFSFEIAPPFWRTWWFVATVFIILGTFGSVFLRIRVERLLEIERIRSRIATDLHDDVGAGLTRIAILSSAAERELRQRKSRLVRKPGPAETLRKIAETARELVDSMSDVVWSLEVGGEPLVKLTQRLRSFALGACEAKEISLSFTVDERISAVQISPESARNILLCAKEAITNVVKHSECTEAVVEFRYQPGGITLSVVDNGKGMEGDEKGKGHGLLNLEKRAKAAGGTLSVSSVRTRGTRVEAYFPVTG